MNTKTNTWLRAIRLTPRILILGIAAAMMPIQSTLAADFASTQPAPRIEDWQRRYKEIDQSLDQSKDLQQVKLLFVGDSITHFWLLGDSPWFKNKQYGRKVWDGAFGKPGTANYAFNLGVTGDRIEHVLLRLAPKSQNGMGQLDNPRLAPEFIVLLIGINNTYAAEEPVVESVFQGVRAVIARLHQARPSARLIVQSLLPTNDPEKNREVVQPINQRIVKLLETPAVSSFSAYLNLYPAFVDTAGTQIPDYFADGLHPNEAGYRVWRDQLLPFIDAQRSRALRSPR